MELEQIARQLTGLAKKGSLPASDHERARTLMKNLRKMGMTNAQISELTGHRWAETTVKEYTRGVTVVDPQPLRSTIALFSEMVSKGLTISDVKETIAVGNKLESVGTSLAEMTSLIAELKKATIDIHSLIALYNEWEASGLTVGKIASALKYKAEIEGMGFGLDSLSDIAGIAKALGNPKDVFEAIGKYQNLTEFDNELKAAQDRLASEESRIRAQIEAGKQEITNVEEREQSARDQLHQLDEEINIKMELLSKGEELEKLGLDPARLGELCTALTRIGAEHGLTRDEALSRFFGELREYDAALGFQAEANRWETNAETKKLETERQKAQLDNLEMRYKEKKEAVDAMESLLKQGVKPAEIPLWNRILSRFKGPEHFDQELEHYQSIEELLKAKGKEVEQRKVEKAELTGQVNSLTEQKAEIEGSIRGLTKAGVESIEKIGRKVQEQLEAGLSQIDKLSVRALEVGILLGQNEKRLAQGMVTKEKMESLIKLVEGHNEPAH